MTEPIIVFRADVDAARLLVDLNQDLGLPTSPAVLALAGAAAPATSTAAAPSTEGEADTRSSGRRSAGATELDRRAAELFAAYRDGQEEAAGHLVGLMTPVLWRTARETGIDPLTAERVLERVWVAWLVEADQIPGNQSVADWLVVRTVGEAEKASSRALVSEGDSERVAAALSFTLRQILSAPEPVAS